MKTCVGMFRMWISLMVSPLNRFARGGQRGWLLATLIWGLQLRHQKYDLAIDVRGEFPLAVLMWLAGATRRIGWDAGGGGFLLTDSPVWIPHRHELASRAALLEVLGHAVTAQQIAPSLQPTSAAQSWFAAQRPTLPGSLQRGMVALHLGSGMSAKRWPTEYWSELVGRLIVDRGPLIVLVGGSDAVSIAAEVLDGHTWPGVVNWTGQLSIAQLTAVLANCQLMIGADSGPAHLAAAVGAPVLALFSGTNHPGQWRPWGAHVEVLRHAGLAPCHREVCPYVEHDCMRNLHPVLVATAARHLWANASQSIPGIELHSIDPHSIKPTSTGSRNIDTRGVDSQPAPFRNMRVRSSRRRWEQNDRDVA